MNSFNKKDIFILILFVLAILCAVESQEIRVMGADDPRWKWQPDVGAYSVLNGGFTTPPQPKYSVILGKSVTITTASARPIWEAVDPFPHITHEWYESTDGKTWSSSGNTSNLVILGKKIGTTRYQLHDRYFQKVLFWGKVYDNNYYSNVITVYVTKGKVKATSAEINFDQDYLLNSENTYFTGKTFAHADLTPSDSTSTAKWYSSDSSIATVDETTGEITANHNGKSGSVIIGAVINNGDSNPVITAKKITVGGGLSDQDAIYTGKATFRLLSMDNSGVSDKIKVQWIRIKKDGTRVNLTNQANPYAYTIDNVSQDNVGDSYQAEITINPKSKHSESFQTNPAKLNVTIPVDPNVKLDSKFYKTGSNNTVGNVLNGIKPDDKIIYSIDLKNVGYQDFNNSYLTLDLPKGMKINYIVTGADSVHSKILDRKEYDISSNLINGSQTLKIKINNFSIFESKNIGIDTTIDSIDSGTSFSTKPYFSGLETKNHNNEYGTKPNSQTLTMNFAGQATGESTAQIGEVTPHFNDIQFEPLVNSQGDIIDHRTNDTNDPNYIATFDDKRTNNKPAMFVYLKQKTPLMNGNHKIDGQLLFYRKDKSPEPIDSGVEVEESQNGQNLAPIKWDRNSGLLLYLKSCNVPTGKYQATLDWTIQNSI